MNLSFEFALIIDDALKKIGYNRRISIRDNKFTYFRIEELALIKTLKLENANSIDELKYLPNLKKLKIEGINYNKIKDKYALEINPFINHIKDFLVIKDLNKLEYLAINNDINIKKLNLKNLKNLKKLRLKNNPELETLKGLESLENLNDVIIYGTNIKNSINLDKYIFNTISVKNNVLDIKIILNEIKNNPKMLRQINDYKRKGLTHLEFAETNGFVDYTKLDTRDLEEMITNLSKELKALNKYDKQFKTAYIFNNIVHNYKFASDQLKERQNVYRKLIMKNNEIPEYMTKYFASLHSSYNLYHFKEGNCEGHVNLMSIMLNLVGIESMIVHCKDKRFKEYTGDTNHAMIRVKLNGKWYYCDPTIDKEKSNNYFLKSKNDLEKTHEISGYEQKIMGDDEYGKYNIRHY